jgi:hypothetical protein
MNGAHKVQDVFLLFFCLFFSREKYDIGGYAKDH